MMVEITVSEHRMDSEINMFLLVKQLFSSSDYRKNRHIKLKIQPRNCYEVWILLVWLEKVQSSLSVEGKSVKCD